MSMEPAKSKILIVDDMRVNIKILGEALKKNYDVVIATNGEKALAMVEEAPPDLILLDIEMPKMDGFEVCRRIKSNGQTQNIPIIFISAVEDETKGFDLGAVDYIVKPFNMAAVNARVRTHLNLKTKNEELKKLNELNNKFLGIASHDLRNPIYTIKSFSEILKDESVGDVNAKQRELLNKIFNASKFMSALLENLLDISKIESGKIDLDRKVQDINVTVKQQVELNQLLADKKSIKLTLSLEDISPLSYDHNAIIQVIDNFLGNAIKFSPAITDIVVATKIFGDFARISVTDKGPGLSEEDQKLLFKKFQTLSAKSTGGEKSTGLGLAIVKKLVHLHGGQVGATSKLGNGSTFFFTLPLQ